MAANNDAVVTEFGFVTIKPGLESQTFDESTSVGKTTRHTMETALRQPGAREAHYATAVERPSQLWLFLDWDRLDDHMNYRKTETNAEIGRGLEPLLDSEAGAGISHIVPPLGSVFNDPTAPIVEVITMSFPGDISDESKKTVNARVDEFIEKGLGGPGIYKKATYGWSLEKDVPVMGEEGKKGSILVLLITWPSVAKHVENTEAQAFKDSAHLIKEMPDLVKMDMFHLECVSKFGKDLK